MILVLPYSAQVHHLVDAAALAKMKPTATLVNIARGGIVDEVALADALSNGRLAAAGLDVYEGEPAVRPELLALRNVVLTPHIASASLATRRAMVSLAVDNLIAALGEGPDAGRPPSPVNPVDYGFAVKKGQPEWLAYVNAFIRKVRADGRLLKAAKANDMEPIVVLK